MADKFDKPSKPASSANGPKKAAPVGNSRLEQAQRKAQAMTSGGRKPIGAGQFFQEAWIELKKTTWPTKEVLFTSTTVVLGLVVATAVYVGVLDYVLTRALSPIFGTH